GVAIMSEYQYYTSGVLHSLPVEPLEEVREKILSAPAAFAVKAAHMPIARGSKVSKAAAKHGPTPKSSSHSKAAEAGRSFAEDMRTAAQAALSQAQRLALFHATGESGLRVVVPTTSGSVTVLTHTVAISGAKKAEIAWLKRQYGMKVIR